MTVVTQSNKFTRDHDRDHGAGCDHGAENDHGVENDHDEKFCYALPFY